MMPLRSFIFLSSLLLSVSATLWAGPFPESDDVEMPIAVDASLASALEKPAEAGDLLQSVEPTAAPAESQSLYKGGKGGKAFKGIRAGLAAQSEYAPLAMFSLGSLAVGGAFYAINVSSRKSNVTQTAGGRSSLTNAVGVAGLTALLAAGSYFYFSRHEPESEADSDSDWDIRVSGGVAPDGDGGMAVGALVTLPIASLSR